MADPGEGSIDLDFREAGLKRFSSIQEFNEWIKGECQYWRWLDALPPSAQAVRDKITERVGQFYNPIRAQVQQVMNTSDDQAYASFCQWARSTIGQLLGGQRMLFSGMPECKFLDELRETDPEIAAHAARTMLDLRCNPAEIMRAKGVEGSFLVIAFKHGFKDRAKSERASLQSLRTEWEGLLTDSKATFEAARTERGTERVDTADTLSAFSHRHRQGRRITPCGGPVAQLSDVKLNEVHAGELKVSGSLLRGRAWLENPAFALGFAWRR